MSVADLREEIRTLSPEEQDHLSAYLVALRQERDPELRESLERQAINEDPSEWLTLDEVKRRLSEEP